MKLFSAAERALGRLEFIAEDLGTIDDGVRRLIKRSGYPSMKVLEFAFDGDPMEEIQAMTRCCFVMKGGEVYREA